MPGEWVTCNLMVMTKLAVSPVQAHKNSTAKLLSYSFYTLVLKQLQSVHWRENRNSFEIKLYFKMSCTPVYTRMMLLVKSYKAD